MECLVTASEDMVYELGTHLLSNDSFREDRDSRRACVRL
jgi:hypothetical protein